jgi:hypothetical protein
VEGFTSVTTRTHTCRLIKTALCLRHCMRVVGLG